MALKSGNTFLIIVLLLAMLMGCDKAQKMIGDTTPDPMPETQTTGVIPVKIVLLIDYPEGGKDAYFAWVASIAETLQAPEELVRLRSYHNQDPDRSPHRFVEAAFKSFLDAVTYLNRPEIAAILADLPNHSSVVTVHTFIQYSHYSKGEAVDLKAKGIFFIDYPLGGKQAYLEWSTSIAPVVTAPPEVKIIATYDNYYGESPHRLVELEFASQADLEAYDRLPEIEALEPEFDNQAGSWVLHTFALHSDYIKE